MRSIQPKGLFQESLYSYSTSGGGLSVRGLLSRCFHCFLKKNEMAVNTLSRETKTQKERRLVMCEGPRRTVCQNKNWQLSAWKY